MIYSFFSVQKKHDTNINDITQKNKVYDIKPKTLKTISLYECSANLSINLFKNIDKIKEVIAIIIKINPFLLFFIKVYYLKINL